MKHLRMLVVMAGLIIVGMQALGCAAGENQPPRAELITVPEMGQVGSDVVFVDASSDEDGRVVSWLWEFGDGSSSKNRFATRSFKDVGIYDTTLTVSDDRGAKDSKSWSLIVYNIIEEMVGIEANETYTYSFDATDNMAFMVLKAETFDSAGSPVEIAAYDADGKLVGSSSTGSAAEKIKVTDFRNLSYGTWKLTIKNLGKSDRFRITLGLYPVTLEKPPCCP